MIGGPEAAFFRVQPLADKWELAKLLRCPVEIYGDDGGVKWWGYVNRVVIPHGKITLSLGLDDVHNAVTVRYKDADTATAIDAESKNEFGRKEFFINLSNADATTATNERDRYLHEHRYPITSNELSGGQGEIKIECLGWWKTLDWMYYTNASTVAVSNITQMRAIIAATGQFINGVLESEITDPITWDSGEGITWDDGESIDWDTGTEAFALTSVPSRDGSGTGLSYLIELLNAGSSNVNPLLAYVDQSRYLHIYERRAEPTGSQFPDYIMREDGRLENLLGRIVEDQNCINAVWVKAQGVPDTSGGLGSFRPFFIDRAEYIIDNNGKGYVHYYSAGAFVQNRLDRYMKSISNTYNGAPYTPPIIGYGGIAVPDPLTETLAQNFAITHDTTIGLLYTNSLDSDTPEWFIWSGGLDATQLIVIDKLLVCKSGAVYVMTTTAGSTAFLSRANFLGGLFTLVEDHDSIVAKYSTDDNPAIVALGQDSTNAELVAYVLLSGGEAVKVFIGSGGTYATGATFTAASFNGADISFGAGKWMFTQGDATLLNAAATSVTSGVDLGTTSMSRHLRLGNTGTTYHWDDTSLISGNALTKSENNGAAITNHIGFDLAGNNHLRNDAVVADATGQRFMALGGPGSNDTPMKSEDFGVTWEVITSLPASSTVYRFHNFEADPLLWIAVGDTVQVTKDFGETWLDKTGNIPDLVGGTPTLNCVKFVPS